MIELTTGQFIAVVVTVIIINYVIVQVWRGFVVLWAFPDIDDIHGLPDMTREIPMPMPRPSTDALTTMERVDLALKVVSMDMSQYLEADTIVEANMVVRLAMSTVTLAISRSEADETP